MKRKLSLIMILVLLCTGLTACGGKDSTENNNAGSGKEVTISYWNPLTGADGAYMRQLVSMFNKEYDGTYEVVETYTAETDYYTNLQTLVPLGKGPDVSIMHSYLVQSYAYNDIIQPIEKMIEASGTDIKRDDYITAVFDSLYYESELYAIPLDVHCVALYYNKALLDKYNRPVPTTRDEMIETAKYIQDQEQAAGNTVWGLPLSTAWPSEWLYLNALYQNGGDEIDANSNPGYNTKEGKLAMTQVSDLIHKYGLSPENLSTDQDLFLFQSGQAVFHFQGTWMLQDIVNAAVGDNVGVIPTSGLFVADASADGAQAVAARSHTFVVPNKKIAEEKVKAIMTFIKYIGDNSSVWAQAGQIPASNVARSTEEYKALPYLADFGNVENFRVAEPSPLYHPAFSPIYSRVTTALLKKDADLDLLFEEAVKEAEGLLDAAKKK